MPATPETLLPILDFAVSTYPEKSAFDFMGKKATYREFGRLIDKAAAGLQEIGLGKGSRIGLLMPNTPYYLIMFFAAMKVGATVVNYDATATETEIGQQLQKSKTDLLVTLNVKPFCDKAKKQVDDNLVGRVIVCDIGDMVPFVHKLALKTLKRKMLAKPDKRNDKIISFRNLTRHKAAPRPVSVGPDDIAVMQFTGGTTGVSKGVLLSHFNLASSFRQISESLGGDMTAPYNAAALRNGQERFLSALPFSHIFGTAVLMVTATGMGAEQVIVADPRNADALARLVQKKQITVLPAIPRTLRLIADRLTQKLPALRLVITGGSALPHKIKEDFENAAGKPGVIIQAYGMTESSACLTSNSVIGGKNRPGSVGLPLAGTKIEIRDLTDPEKKLAPLQTGEIFAQGPQIMRGYLDDPETTATALQKGWLRTGDIGYLDDEGYLYLAGRAKEIIKIKGKTVFPLEIEDALLKHDAVLECAVVGIEDADTGEAAKAFVRLNPDPAKPVPDESELRHFLAENLSKVKIPKYFEFRSEALPVTKFGKPDKKALQQPTPVQNKIPRSAP